jgi:hypothetical protein
VSFNALFLLLHPFLSIHIPLKEPRFINPLDFTGCIFLRRIHSGTSTVRHVEKHRSGCGRTDRKKTMRWEAACKYMAARAP